MEQFAPTCSAPSTCSTHAPRWHPRLVCISTDKAASPSSVMGASKWLAEQIVLSAPADGAPLGSLRQRARRPRKRDSHLQRQIAAGGPVTVTDPRMARCFMSTDEAVKLVLLGAAIAGDHKVLALEMGEQVNIYALAERMIRLCGLRPHDDVEIAITGMRPGEKLAEAVFSPAEGRAPAHGEALLSIEPVPLGATALAAALEQLEVLTVNGDDSVRGAARLRPRRGFRTDPAANGRVGSPDLSASPPDDAP